MTAATPIDGTRETIPVREIIVRLAYLHGRGDTLNAAEIAEGIALSYLLATAGDATTGTFVLDGKVAAFTKGNRKLRVRGRGTLFNAVYYLVDR